VLLLDEPTRSLDAANTAHFWTTIRTLAAQRTTILLATHNFAEAASVADRLLLLQRGEVLADRRLGNGESADTLRSFYFQTTGEMEEVSAQEGRRLNNR
jgi:ABC-type multidrug transport system ATPase subunit